MPHASRSLSLHLRNDDQLLAAGEGDVALVKQVIDVRREQQAIGAVEALGIGRVPPRLDVTSFQMPRLVHTRDATELLAQENVGPEHALATSRSDKLLSERRSDDARIEWLRLHIRRLRTL